MIRRVFRKSVVCFYRLSGVFLILFDIQEVFTKNLIRTSKSKASKYDSKDQCSLCFTVTDARSWDLTIRIIEESNHDGEILVVDCLSSRLKLSDRRSKCEQLGVVVFRFDDLLSCCMSNTSFEIPRKVRVFFLAKSIVRMLNFSRLIVVHYVTGGYASMLTSEACKNSIHFTVVGGYPPDLVSRKKRRLEANGESCSKIKLLYYRLIFNSWCAIEGARAAFPFSKFAVFVFRISSTNVIDPWGHDAIKCDERWVTEDWHQRFWVSKFADAQKRIYNIGFPEARFFSETGDLFKSQFDKHSKPRVVICIPPDQQRDKVSDDLPTYKEILRGLEYLSHKLSSMQCLVLLSIHPRVSLNPSEFSQWSGSITNQLTPEVAKCGVCIYYTGSAIGDLCARGRVPSVEMNLFGYESKNSCISFSRGEILDGVRMVESLVCNLLESLREGGELKNIVDFRRTLKFSPPI